MADERTYYVSTLEELYAALTDLEGEGGATILLAPGEYGELVLSLGSKFDYTFQENITIASADPENPAVFDGMMIAYAENITLDGLFFDYSYSDGDPNYTASFHVKFSNNVTISNSTFDGELASGISEIDDGYGWGNGLQITNSSNVSLENNTVYDFTKGFVINGSTDISITDNELYGLRGDGMVLSTVQGVLIEGNYIHDFNAAYDSTDHRDMIQILSANRSTPSTDITIRGNTFDIGQGSWTQTIWMRNEAVDAGAGTEMYYQNVVIEDNIIYNSHTHGIAIGQTDGLTISNNTLIRVDDTNSASVTSAALWTPKISVHSNSVNVSIAGNVTSSVVGYTDQESWTVDNNVTIQNSDSSAAGYYEDVFVSSSLTSDDGSHNYVVQPGGLIDTSGAGASGMAAGEQTGAVTALFDVSAVAPGSLELVLDAGASLAGGNTLPEGTTFTWDFGDGSSLTTTEAVVHHTYTDAGYYSASLTVILIDGSTQATTGKDLELAGRSLVSFDNATGVFNDTSHGQTMTVTETGSIGGLQLGTDGVTTATVSREVISSLKGTEAFDLSMTLKADTLTGGAGEIFRIHTVMVASTNSAGNLIFSLTNADGQALRLITSGVNLADGAEHDITIHYDSAEAVLAISVDGVVRASGTLSGELSTSVNRDLIFGNPWGAANFDGTLTAFDLSADSVDYPVYTGELAETAQAVETLPLENYLATEVNLPEADLTGVELSEEMVPEASVSTEYVLDIAALAPDATSVKLEGAGDYIKLGRLTDFEDSEQITISVDYARDTADGSTGRIVWNHTKIGISVWEDGLLVQIATEEEGFKSFTIDDLGLNDTENHNVTLLLDAQNDRMQILVDSTLVLDETATDFDIVNEGGYEWGWTLGSAYSTPSLDGEILDLWIDDEVSFVDTLQQESLLA